MTRKFLLTACCSLFLMIGKSQDIQFQNRRGRLILGTQKARTASLGLGDIDNDGDIDVVVANGRHWPEQNRVFFNSGAGKFTVSQPCLLYTSPSPRDQRGSRMPSSA